MRRAWACRRPITTWSRPRYAAPLLRTHTRIVCVSCVSCGVYMLTVRLWRALGDGDFAHGGHHPLHGAHPGWAPRHSLLLLHRFPALAPITCLTWRRRRRRAVVARVQLAIQMNALGGLRVLRLAKQCARLRAHGTPMLPPQDQQATISPFTLFFVCVCGRVVGRVACFQCMCRRATSTARFPGHRAPIPARSTKPSTPSAPSCSTTFSLSSFFPRFRSFPGRDR